MNRVERLLAVLLAIYLAFAIVVLGVLFVWVVDAFVSGGCS